MPLKESGLTQSQICVMLPYECRCCAEGPEDDLSVQPNREPGGNPGQCRYCESQIPACTLAHVLLRDQGRCWQHEQCVLFAMQCICRSRDIEAAFLFGWVRDWSLPQKRRHNMKKRLAVVLMGCMLAFATAVCAAETETDISTDRSGNPITLPEKVESIISMAPSTTRILLDLGLSENIVACDTYSFGSYGSELSADIPQFDMMTPDQEQIIALGADIIFTTGMSASQGTDVFAAVRESGACVADIPSSASLADIEEDIRFIGACVGKGEEAEAIADDMQEKIEEFSEIGSSIPEEEKKSVLFELYTPSADNPIIYTAGNGTYINEMLELIGAVN